MAQTARPSPTSSPTQGSRGAHESRAPLPQSAGYGVKRALLGHALPTSQLIHERLGKLTALAVFSSDALSSVAYATEEMLKTLFVAGVGAAAFSLIMPLSFAIVGVLAILIFSYRQTIRAYPSAGGAYIVTKDNFGVLPAQVAGAALLTDYVLTVAVSTSAGVAAIVAAAPSAAALRTPIALAFIALITVGNLRGVRESGRIFAVPTYLFILSIGSLILIGIVRLSSGGLHPTGAPVPASAGGGLLAGVAVFTALHALASGSTAMTGVEAISNGVPAFRAPAWRNARTTLLAMGLILGTMFLSISFLAHRLQIAPDLSGRSTVLADVARALYGAGAIGHAAFLVLTVATTLILVLAANTAFADFPRLAHFLADDGFLPRQFTMRGHRLVYSNGIIALAATAAALVIAFEADVTKLIPFYAIGVFTSFTLSQAGMARRHLRLREPGWKLGLAINGLGAIATATVLGVIAVTKFTHGAWAVVTVVPVIVWLLFRLNHQYRREHQALEEGLTPFVETGRVKPLAIVLVDDVDRKTLHALQYAKTIRPSQIRVLHLETDPREHASTEALRARWSRLGLDDAPLHVVRCDGDAATALAGYVAALPDDVEVNVIVPAPAAAETSPLDRLRRGRLAAHLTAAVAPYDRVRTTLVRDHEGPGHQVEVGAGGGTHRQVLPRPNHRVVVLVDQVGRPVLRAVGYALSLGATDVRALHASVDEHAGEHVAAEWMQLGVPVPLDIVECWDRNVARSLEAAVVDMIGDSVEVTVIMPRRDYPQLRQRVLHDRTSRRIARALGRYPHVDISVVPYYLAPSSDRPAPEPSGAS